jgi:muramidase (phage lysozyme)
MSASRGAISKSLDAFLDTITLSELGAALITPRTEYGYLVIVGSTPERPILMTTYADHPRVVIEDRPGQYSTAAGAYQILAGYFDSYKAQLDLPDFSPSSQDKIAIQLLRECRALSLIEHGKIEDAIYACSSRWASFPRHSGDEHGAYGQGANHIESLLSVYRTYVGAT